MRSPTFSRTLVAASIVTVLAAYVFFATTGKMTFRRIRWQESMYADLAEGFLRGQLSLASEPSPALRALSNPYDEWERGRLKIDYPWDASYYEGRYYLYFTPVPILLFSIPFHAIARGFPADNLVTVTFTAWAFLSSAAFILRARRGEPWSVPRPLWILLLGLGGFVPYVLTVAGAAYQVAIACGMAMTATWAYALLLYIERPSASRAAFVALWLGLAIASRPNLAPLVLVTAFMLWRQTSRELRLRHFAGWLLPLGAIALALMTYNYARFRHPFEFGTTYQLGTNLIGGRLCGICTGAEAVRFVNMLSHHVLQPPNFGGPFPWVDLAWSRVDRQVSPGSEQSAGIAALTPLTLFATVLLLAGYGRNRGAGGAAANYAMLGSWAILLSVATCWFVAARYSLDYAMLMTSATVLSLEALMAGEGADRTRRLRWISVSLILYSLVLGTLLGFSGPYDAFKRQNPDLLNRITGAAPPAPAFEEWVRLRGWVIYIHGPVEITVEGADGVPIGGSTVTRVHSPDIYEHFSKRWKAHPPARNARFIIEAPLDAYLVLWSDRGMRHRIRLKDHPGIVLHPDLRMAIDAFDVRLKAVKKPA